jgi:hypothetical protein
VLEEIRNRHVGRVDGEQEDQPPAKLVHRVCRSVPKRLVELIELNEA